MSDLDLATATPEQLAAIAPADFLGLIKGMSDKEIDAVMAGPARAAVLGSIFGRMPELFMADKAGSLAATTHWTITGGPDGASDEFTVAVADGVCTSAPGHEGDATLSLTMAPTAFTKVITKTGNPVMMFMTGKIKAKGDLSLAANFANLFDTGA